MADPEAISWIRVLVAFVVVFGLISLMAMGLKQYGTKGFRLPGRQQAGAGRLQILESLNLDVRRKLVIVRQDDQEHLLLLGANQDIVVAANLKKPTLSRDV